MYVEYDSILFVRLLPPVPAAFLAGTFAAFFPTAGVLAILLLVNCTCQRIVRSAHISKTSFRQTVDDDFL